MSKVKKLGYGVRVVLMTGESSICRYNDRKTAMDKLREICDQLSGGARTVLVEGETEAFAVPATNVRAVEVCPVEYEEEHADA